MTMFEERDCELNFSVSDKSQTVAAPWFLAFNGEPIQLPIPAGAKALYDPKRKILHVRDSNRGYAHTVTPSVQVRLDYQQNFHDIEYVDLSDPTKRLAGFYISDGRLSFEDKKRYAFSNTVMFECVCRLLASPVFNPWTCLPKIENEHALLMGDFESGKLWPNPEIKEITQADEVRSEIVSIAFETTEPMPCWNKDSGKDDILPPAIYHSEVIKTEWDTGKIITVKADGWTIDRQDLCTFFIPFEPILEKIKNRTIATGDPVFRVDFDPRLHTDMALNATKQKAKSALLSRLVGR